MSDTSQIAYRRNEANVIDIFIGLMLSCSIGVIALFVFTRNNEFPVAYHPDEAGKAEQIMDSSQPRNFNQPLLLLEAANIVRSWSGVPEDTRLVVIAGRWTSAGLAVLAVLSLTIVAASKSDWRTAILCGIVVALCPPLSVYAHYFKEDTALLVGIAIAILGTRMVVDGTRRWLQTSGIVVLGVGAATAISGKYVGLVILLPCCVALCVAPIKKWWDIPVRFIVFCAVAGASILAINARAFQNVLFPRLLPLALQQFKGEIAHGTTGHDYLALPTPNLYCLRVACSELMPDIWAFLFIGVALIIFRRHVTRWGIALGVFVAVFIGALSYDSIPFGRYALPITVLAYFSSAQMIPQGVIESRSSMIDFPSRLRREITSRGGWYLSLTRFCRLRTHYGEVRQIGDEPAHIAFEHPRQCYDCGPFKILRVGNRP